MPLVADVAVGAATGFVNTPSVYHSTVVPAAPEIIVLSNVVRSTVAVPDPGALSQKDDAALTTSGSG
jgi:hypothetical protein